MVLLKVYIFIRETDMRLRPGVFFHAHKSTRRNAVPNLVTSRNIFPGRMFGRRPFVAHHFLVSSTEHLRRPFDENDAGGSGNGYGRGCPI